MFGATLKKLILELVFFVFHDLCFKGCIGILFRSSVRVRNVVMLCWSFCVSLGLPICFFRSVYAMHFWPVHVSFSSSLLLLFSAAGRRAFILHLGEC